MGGEEILRNDILIPYLLLVQDLSDFNKDKKAQVGDICKSTTAEKYGDAASAADAIFLHYPKANWILEEKPPGATRFKYRKMFARTASNENLSWDFWGDQDGNEVPAGTRGASQWKRVKQLAVFAILKKDLEDAALEKKKLESGDLPDPNKSLTPVMISFRGVSYQAGKEICTFFTQAKSSGVDIFRYMLPIKAELYKDEEVSYHMYKVDRNKFKPTPKEQLDVVRDWAQMVSQNNNLKVHDEVEEVQTQAQAPAAREVKNYAPGS